MKDKLLKIIKGPHETEPIYQLESEYKGLANEIQKREFLSIIKSFAMDGTVNERFICLTTIEFLDKAKECVDVIKSNVDQIVFEKNEKLLSPLLTLCAVLSTEWAINFIQKVITYFKPRSNEYIYYFDISLRSMVCTVRWKEVVDEIRWVLKNYDEDYVIDFVAFFKWKRGNYGLEELIELMRDDLLVFEKIADLESKVRIRYVGNYLKLSKNE